MRSGFRQFYFWKSWISEHPNVYVHCTLYVQRKYFIRSAVLSTMSGQRGMIQSSGKVSTLLSRRFWQTNLLPQLVKSFFLSYELLKRSFFPLQTPMCATRSISISLTSDHRVNPSLILIRIIVTSRTAHQFILQNLCYIMCSNTRTCYPLKLVITTWNKKTCEYNESHSHTLHTGSRCTKGQLKCTMCREKWRVTNRQETQWSAGCQCRRHCGLFFLLR